MSLYRPMKVYLCKIDQNKLREMKKNSVKEHNNKMLSRNDVVI